MPIRRAADPISVQHVWDAIRSAVLHHQMADAKRIIKYLQKVDKCTEAQAELYIQQTIQDGLIVALQKVTKTSKGDPIDSFRIPTNELPLLDGKDWYCFECHLAGDVNTCLKCFRVFHSDCISNGRKKFDDFKKINTLRNQNKTLNKSVNIMNVSSDSDEKNDSSSYPLSFNNNSSSSEQLRNDDETDENFDDALCSICNLTKINDNFKLDKSELNYLLKFVIHRIQSWLPNTITHTMVEGEKQEWMTDKELDWRANQLFFEHRDMSVIEVNLNNEFYNQIQEFLADVLTIQHNVAIFHGIESQEHGAAELMMRDCLHDLTELRLCVDCYRHSNEKVNSKWFCLPCRIPHKLVWAKQKGYPYWPAKVIQETNFHYDVRFFGGKYERSLLGKTYIKPIETPQSKLQIKTSSAFNKSVEELRYHQKLLNNPDELQKLISSSKSKPRNSMNKRSSSVKKTTNEVVNRLDTSIDDIYHFDDSLHSQQGSFNSSRSKRRNEVIEAESPASKRSSNVDLSYDDKSQHNLSDNIIHISDEDEEFSFRESFSAPNMSYNGTCDQPVPTTQPFKYDSTTRKQENGMQRLDQPFSDSVEKMRRKMEGLTDKKDIIKCSMESMQIEIDVLTNEHNDHLKRLFESHNAQISEIKKKQWCYNCEQEAIYHCCWNTAYCSQSCQQQHWQADHKKVCRRKRQDK